MAKTDLILIKKVSGLGGESDPVTVSAGYARNYLVPQGLAVPQTAANKRQMDVLKSRRESREKHELDTAKELAASLSKMLLHVKVKTGDDGKMFGSVTSANIADEIHQQFEIDIDKRKIDLESPIKATGDYEVKLHLHPETSPSLKVRVESSNPRPAREASAAAEPGASKKE